jgi:hypothetical protein
VSKAALDAGGFVHGIVPRALVERARENVPAPGSSSSTEISSPEDAKSGEGAGKDLLEDNVDGRLTVEIVGTMHDVRWV